MANKRRAVITGYGALSCIGNDNTAVEASLRAVRSGIRHSTPYAERNMRCHVCGPIDVDPSAQLERKQYRFMGKTSAYASLAANEAVANSGLTPEQLNSHRTAAFIGAGGNGVTDLCEALDIVDKKGPRRLSPYYVTKVMDNSPSAIISTNLRVRGPSYTISSACSTSAHCIGTAYEQIVLDNIDCAVAGGGEEECWQISVLFDAMGALSSKYNDTPEIASRPFDSARDGFVPSGGAGIVVVEELEYARQRGANIIGEIVGYGATSDGADMVAPSGEGAMRCMQNALRECDPPDYINAHATSTPLGDLVELQAIRSVLGDKIPPISSTKALTGHALGAAGSLELIYSLMMMEGNFIVPCANLQDPDGEAANYPLQRELEANANLQTIMSNSFGFGGTNASLVVARHSE